LSVELRTPNFFVLLSETKDILIMTGQLHPDLMKTALIAGYERIVVWADILDRINVYPVPDGDTGRNLVITLSPLRNKPLNLETVIKEILLSARGNSGNIAAQFLAGVLGCNNLENLSESVKVGRDLAYNAVPIPQPGTMLSLYDVLATALQQFPPDDSGMWIKEIIPKLEEAVKMTTAQLPELKEAGVVDAGALGMLVFLDPLLTLLAGREVQHSSFMNDLKEALFLSDTWQGGKFQGYCLDVVLKVEQEEPEVMKHILNVGESLVTIYEGDHLKLHLHAKDREKVKQDLSYMGAIVRWAEDDLAEQTFRFCESPKNQRVHIMTDAAGSMSRDLSQKLGVTLLNSYITIGTLCLPETYIDPAKLFTAMKAGVKVSTCQASVAERNEIYNNLIQLYDRIIYLCVGSFYTGNYQEALKWKAAHDLKNRMTIIDTGLASGKLGLVVRVTAELANNVSNQLEIVSIAEMAIQNVKEYIFLDRLQFLAAGGRMSKTGAFFGDAFHIKPIISPFSDGARKIGVVRTTKEQVKFAFQRLEQELPKEGKATLLLEYSDNRAWLEKEIKPEIEGRFPQIRVHMQLISLTSAAHMGPGSWGIAFLPEFPHGPRSPSDV